MNILLFEYSENIHIPFLVFEYSFQRKYITSVVEYMEILDPTYAYL